MTKSKLSNTLVLGLAASILSKFLFGFSFMFSKQAADAHGVFPLLSWRFIVAFLAFSILILFGVMKVDYKKKVLRPIILISLLQPVLYFILETFGIKATTASESGSILACIPVGAIIASSIILKKKPTRLQVLGIAATVVGVILCVLTKGMEVSFSLFGYVMLFLCIVDNSLYCVYIEKTTEFTATEKTYMMAFIGAVCFTGLALVSSAQEGELMTFLSLPLKDRDFLVAILYQGIGCSVLAYLFENYSLEVLGTNISTSFMGLTTVVAILAGVVFLGESFSTMQIIGTVTILAGVYIANFKLVEGDRGGS